MEKEGYRGAFSDFPLSTDGKETKCYELTGPVENKIPENAFCYV
jgi:hypothetical protein